MNSSAGHDGEESTSQWAARLVRPDDRELENLAFTTFKDAGHRFQLGAGDQAVVSSAFSYLHRGRPGSEVLVLALPRGRHDVALGVALAVQCTQLDRLATPLAALLCPWKGSIVVVGQNTAVQSRLGELQIDGVYMRGGVANALRTYRVRNDGMLAGPDGSVSEHGGGSGRLLYLNTRTQWPQLPAEKDPLVIIDATKIGRSSNVGRALEWADAHGARHVIVVSHLGDRSSFLELERAGRTPLAFDLAREMREPLVHELGHAAGDAALSSNELLHLPEPTVRVRPVGADELAHHLFVGLTALRNAPGSQETWPYAVVRAHRLLTGLRRLVDDMDAYNRAAAVDPWLTSFGSALRAVERAAELPRVRSRWRTFSVAQWGTVRHSAIEACQALEMTNPKLEALVDEIDRALRDPDRTVLVRTADGVGATSLPNTLAERLGADALGRVHVMRCGEVRPWLEATSGPVTEIFPGAPAAWDGSWLFTGESTDRVVLAYPFEVRWVARSGERHLRDLQTDRQAFFDRFGFGASPTSSLTIGIPPVSPPPRNELATLQVQDLWERILELDEPPPAEYDAADRVVRHGARSSAATLQVKTDDGRTHLVPCDHEVEVFVGGRYRIRLADELRIGDVMLYTTGTGRESLFTRLVAASHRALGVDDLDLVMRRFRDACRRIHTNEGSWAAGNRALEAAGASAGTQLQAWATGDTIAPADPEDVRIVAAIANDQQLSDNWFRIQALATELRSLHQRLGRVLSAAIAEALDGGGPHVRRVSQLVGADAAEIFDEFTSATITDIEKP